MRIGELAEAVGVSTRTIRYYHQVGLLPEPARTPSGYRRYAVRDLIRLSRARRLVDLGLGLDEVRDVLAGEEGRELAEVIAAMDAELALQIERLTEQRRRIGVLQDRVRDGKLDVDDLPTPELLAFFGQIEAAGATGPIAQLDRDILAFLPANEAKRWVTPMIPLMDDPSYARRVVQMYDDFDRLAEVAPDDPAVAALVEDCIDLLPEASLDALAGIDLVELTGRPVLDAVFSELTPAQTAAAESLLQRCQDLSPPTDHTPDSMEESP